jgi:colanic acid biosynthesis protein WcaH
VNHPAKGTWFVPGGRILKDESFDAAFERICQTELGITYARAQACFVGAYEHRYETNFHEESGTGTHYVALAYRIQPTKPPDSLPSTQHSGWRWFTKTAAISDPDVHRHVLPYFCVTLSLQGGEARLLAQYEILNARRDSFNNLLWQTPVISLTGLAFLFTIALAPDVTECGRWIAASLAFITALASLQLLMRHRFFEENHATELEKFEKQHGLQPINAQQMSKCSFNPKTWPSYCIWIVILLLFAIAAGVIFFFPSFFVSISKCP